ncbi:MAG: MBL fold metallo-hydrolase [Planctomycetota bacterium]
MQFTISAFSTALFSTWVFIEELGLLFDAGDGVAAALMQKSRKANHLFFSHPDRDHLGGILQLYQLNAREGKPTIGYPKDSGSFPALERFVSQFDPQSGPATWLPLDDGQTIKIGGKRQVTAIRNGHIVSTPASVKSLSYLVTEDRSQLKAEFQGLTGEGIANLRRQHGDAYVLNIERKPMLGFSGDTPALEPDVWLGVPVLIHECTFLKQEDTRGQHSHLEQVLEASRFLPLEHLILTHFSSRYSHADIQEAVTETANRLDIRFNIFLVLPGETARDILNQAPVWAPSR